MIVIIIWLLRVKMTLMMIVMWLNDCENDTADDDRNTYNGNDNNNNDLG